MQISNIHTAPQQMQQMQVHTIRRQANFRVSTKFYGMPVLFEPTQKAVPIFSENDLEILEDDSYTPKRYFVMYKGRRVGSRIKIYKNHQAFCRMVLLNAAKIRKRVAAAYQETINSLEDRAKQQLQVAASFETQGNLIPKAKSNGKCAT